MGANNIEPVFLPQQAYAEIVEHARLGKPEEICGVLRGRGNRAFTVIKGQNIASERIENYEVDPQTLLLQFKFEDEGDEMMGIYHSHPVSEAYPSATDAWNAHYPESIYFICSLENENEPVIRAFRMQTHFMQLDIAKLSHILDFYETRPNLFAYFQAKENLIPTELAEIAKTATSPFYIVYYTDGDSVEGRVVTLSEYPVEIT